MGDQAPGATRAVNPHRRLVLVGGAGAALAPRVALAAKLPVAPITETERDYTLVTRDLSPRFLDFYAAAQGLSPDARFQVWKDRYDFAAVPPGPGGEAIARQLLDAAWPKYASAMPVISAGYPGMRPRPLDVLIKVGALFQAPTPMRVGFTAYVGGFEINAFTAADKDGVVVSAPIEMDVAQRTLTLPHEMTHAVHINISHLSGGYERALGRVVFEEGLAMRATQHLVPDHPDHDYVGDEPWFSQGMAVGGRVLSAMTPDLFRSDAETLLKYTFGSGNTGREREAYLAGWIIVGRLLKGGRSFPELARIPEADLPALVQRTALAITAERSESRT